MQRKFETAIGKISLRSRDIMGNKQQNKDSLLI